MLKEELRTFLRDQRIWLDTDAGQHFLVNDAVLADIVDAAKIVKTDHVWEIGPGIGILTGELVKLAKHVTAVEIDTRFPPLIQKFTGNPKNLTIIAGNSLQERTPEGAYKVVANIPYHITSPLLTHLLLESANRPESMTLLIQREVAENIASEGSDSILTVLVGLFGKAKIVRLVPPESFMPPPEVDSAVLHVDCFKEPKADIETAKSILKLAKHAMHQRRKMLRNTIGSLPGGAEAMETCGIEPDRRPQTLTTDEWIALEKKLRS